MKEERKVVVLNLRVFPDKQDKKSINCTLNGGKVQNNKRDRDTPIRKSQTMMYPSHVNVI